MPINPIMMVVLFFSTLISSFICDPQVGQYDTVSSFNFSPHLLQYFVMIIVIILIIFIRVKIKKIY